MLKSRKMLALVALVVVAAVAAGGLYYLFGRSTPAAVSLPIQPAGAPTLAPSNAAPGATGSPGVTGSPAASTASTAASEGLSGTWTVDPGIGSAVDFSNSFVGYRVQEELVGLGAATAVGRTSGVSGSLVIDGTTITAATFVADLTGLRSDSDLRDGQLARQGIETARFPTATFVLTAPITLDQVPADGQIVAVDATGDFTLHGVTRNVVIPLSGRLSNGVITIVGSLELSWPDYDITKPQSMRVLSIADSGTMELQLQLTR